MKQLIEAASVIAIRGAQHYIANNKLQAEPSALASCIRAWVKIKFPEALHDAKEAIACNMGKVAEATFAATMIQAGVEAAKEASLPINCPALAVQSGS